MFFAVLILFGCAILVAVVATSYFWNWRGAWVHERHITYKCSRCPTEMIEKLVGGDIRERTFRYHGDHHVCEELHLKHDWIEV